MVVVPTLFLSPAPNVVVVPTLFKEKQRGAHHLTRLAVVARTHVYPGLCPPDISQVPACLPASGPRRPRNHARDPPPRTPGITRGIRPGYPEALPPGIMPELIEKASVPAIEAVRMATRRDHGAARLDERVPAR